MGNYIWFITHRNITFCRIDLGDILEIYSCGIHYSCFIMMFLFIPFTKYANLSPPPPSIFRFRLILKSSFTDSEGSLHQSFDESLLSCFHTWRGFYSICDNDTSFTGVQDKNIGSENMDMLVGSREHWLKCSMRRTGDGRRWPTRSHGLQVAH